MIDCMIIGDSIGVGTQRAMPECVSYSKGGWNTWQWNRDYLQNDLTAKTVIISLGTNDHKGVNTFKELLKTREKISGSRVFWIMPPCNPKFCKPHVNEVVEIIAKQFGDTIVGTQKLQPDAIHPSWAGYKEIAQQTK